MSKDKWAVDGPEPQPGDFDEYLDSLGPEDVEIHEGSPEARVTIVEEPPESRTAPPRR